MFDLLVLILSIKSCPLMLTVYPKSCWERTNEAAITLLLGTHALLALWSELAQAGLRV